MKKAPMMIAAALAASAAAGDEANAFNCAVPAFVSVTKQSVCAAPVVRRLDQEEDRGYTALRRSFAPPARTALMSDHQSFVDQRAKCAADIRCLEATYRAQVRLYEKLKPCTATPGDQRVCVTRTISAHREELHRSL
jgi:uncharacterized protein